MCWVVRRRKRRKRTTKRILVSTLAHDALLPNTLCGPALNKATKSVWPAVMNLFAMSVFVTKR